MGKIIKISEYLEQQEIEKEYQNFLTQINRILKLPTDMPKLINAFYFTLRYLEGTVNSFIILSSLNKLSYDIDEMNESLSAYKKYYNENIVDYNKLIRKFPYNIIGKILKYKEKMFFDGKDLNDDNIKDFKL